MFSKTHISAAAGIAAAIVALAFAAPSMGGVRDASGTPCSTHDNHGRRSMVLVAEPGRTAALVARVRATGGSVCDRFGRIVEAVVPAGASAFSRDAESVRPSAVAVPFGEGVDTTHAVAWHSRGLAGAGTKVAIIDLGFGGLDKAQAAGFVPRSAVRVDFCPNVFGVQNHGTAVAEVVAEEAPAATLYLICVDNELSLARAETYVVAHRIPIVSHSVGWFGSSIGNGKGGPGTPDAIIADASANGILWINAAGNEAQRHWRGPFTDANGNGFHEFAPGDDGNDVTVLPGAYVCAYLRWNEWPTAIHDYDVFIHDADGQYLAGSQADQRHSLALEQACWQHDWQAQEPRSVKVTIRGRAGEQGGATLDLFVDGVRSIEHWVAAGSIADPATSPNTLAVGAVCWQTNELEFFSSQGPTIDGRLKPELVAPDSVSSPVYGPFHGCGVSGFAGTSAAAPYVAGAAALVKQRFPRYKAERIESYLLQHAIDLGERGFDPLYGAGLLLLP